MSESDDEKRMARSVLRQSELVIGNHAPHHVKPVFGKQPKTPRPPLLDVGSAVRDTHAPVALLRYAEAGAFLKGKAGTQALQKKVVQG